MTLIRLLSILSAVDTDGLPGAWFAILTDQIIRSALIAWRYQSGRWKESVLRTKAAA